MLIPDDELERMQKRFPYPRFSKGEYERRYANIRNMMRGLHLDCLLIVGGSAAYGRCWFNFRYVVNMLGKAELANYCFFPKDGEPAVMTRPGHSLAGGMLARTAVRNVIVGKPSVLDAIVNEIKEHGYDQGASALSNTIPTLRFRRITGISSRGICRGLISSSSPRNLSLCACSKARKRFSAWKNPRSLAMWDCAPCRNE